MLTALAWATNGYAAPALDVEQMLDFGILALRDNTTPSALRISAAGQAVSSGEIIVIGGARAGEYRLNGFPPGVRLRIEIDDGTLSEGGFGIPEFFLTTAFEHPEEVFSATSGEATFRLGARLQNSASGTLYADAPYSGSVQLHVQYWSPEAQGYLTFTETLEFSARVRSTLALEELRPLSFGALAAHSHPVDIATLTLSPAGTLESGTSSGARLTPLGGAQSGRIRVSGAAPNHMLHITPQAGSVLLSHTDPNINAPQFLARNFTTLPAGSGRSSANGELELAIGATLETLADPRPYLDGQYRGTYELTISY
ncbi:DUF4402 domain-containing protein [Pseudothauera lacus]|uniref:DUF4402 domain-containing protein n=1 Tax=Pseudothauera lacus TaxID=2136175 RepID=UPI0015E66D14|nr:DUF4402 domain-containing protein [Pseudothauera lacus]